MRNVYTAIAKAAALVAIVSASSFAAAAGTQNINVSATVNTVCKFTTGADIAMTFTAIDPSTTGDKTKTVNVPFQCTKGTADTTMVVSGAGSTTLTSGSDTMTYSIAVGTIPAGNGFGNAATNAPVTGTIPDTSYQNAPAGTYTGTAVLTINH